MYVTTAVMTATTSAEEAATSDVTSAIEKSIDPKVGNCDRFVLKFDSTNFKITGR